MLRKVITQYGEVEGLPSADPRVTVFKGVPFAKPPVGENRWRAPQPMDKWDGVYKAYSFAPISVQDVPGLGDNIYNKEWNVDPEIPMDEDCLYLNIWSGANSADDKLPVLVWFFGGAFQWGNTQEMEFDGERLARRGIIVVSVNYRLACLGFMAHPELTKEQPDAPTNFGSLDQKAGLHWVYENIAAFGGDPDNISIAGQSAGAASVMAQMGCKENRDIIKGAVIFSGMIREPYGTFKDIRPLSLQEAEALGVSFFNLLGISSLKEARALDPYYIRDKYAEFAMTNPRMSLLVDGQFIEDDPYELYISGKSVNVPVMSGNTHDEFEAYIAAADKNELKEKIEAIAPGKAEAFIKLLNDTNSDTGRFGIINAVEYSVKAAFSKRAQAEDNMPGYYYAFEPDIPGEDNPGCFHSIDLWFFFESISKCWRPFRGRHFELARQMADYFANFVKYHNPNGTGIDKEELPKWQPYTTADRSEMHFTKSGAVSKSDENEFVRALANDIF